MVRFISMLFGRKEPFNKALPIGPLRVHGDSGMMTSTRRDFFRSLFATTAAIAVAPLVPITPTPLYEIPVISWGGVINPARGMSDMELLDILYESGIPIPIRMRVAAAGLNLDDILNNTEHLS